MINNLGFSVPLSVPIMFGRGVVYTRTPVRRSGIVPTEIGLQIGGSGNDIINIGGGTPGPVGPPGPPGPPGTPGLVPVTLVTTTPFVATLTDYYLAVDVPSPSAITLPISPTGTVFIVKDMSGLASTTPITVTGLGALIDGAASGIVSTDYGSITLVFNGTEWNIV